MKWHRINGLPNITEPFITKVKIGGKSICLVGFERHIYALSSICPHAGADLSEGLCAKGKLVCPYHRYTYSLQTGKGGEGQNDYVAIYPVEIKEGEVYVGVSSVWDKLKQAFK